MGRTRTSLAAQSFSPAAATATETHSVFDPSVGSGVGQRGSSKEPYNIKGGCMMAQQLKKVFLILNEGKVQNRHALVGHGHA